MTKKLKLKPMARIRVAGPDQRGIIATVTTYLAHQGINIEDIDQRILDGFLVMNMLVDLSSMKGNPSSLKEGFKRVSSKIRMQISFQPIEHKKVKDVVLFVTKEEHVPQALLQKMKTKEIPARVVGMIANRPDLESLAKKYRVPFHFIPAENKKVHEEKILELLSDWDVDLIVLARYMQIISPEFCFRYEGRMINIHPSLLPSFPGARAYSQAFHKGVEIAGVTAHFVTTDLDQGPIISQESFVIDKNKDSLDDVIRKGRRHESSVLCRAVKLFCQDRLVLRRGKVVDDPESRATQKKVKEFYADRG